MATATAEWTPQQWAQELLHALGAPNTHENQRAIVGWEAAEGGNWNNTARFNPLNTTQPAPGAGNTGTQGNIKIYTSWQQGINATVETLRNGDYGGILEALANGNNAGAVADAIGRSPWGTNASLVASTIGSSSAPSGEAPAGSSPPPAQASPGSGGLGEWLAKLAERGSVYVGLLVAGVVVAGVGLYYLLRGRRPA